MIKKITCSLLMSSICLIANLAEAKNLIGMDYVRVISGTIWPDDSSEHGYHAGITYNRNLSETVDFQLSLDTSWVDDYLDSGIDFDVNVNQLSTGLIWFKSCDEMSYKFIGLDALFQELDIDSIPSRTDVGVGINAGIEKMINDCVLSRAAVNYSYVNNPIIKNDNCTFDTEVGYWINEEVFASLGASYYFTADRALASLGITVEL